ncbi:MAG: hypothetical protein HY023_10170, partial [Chloroflexi bacterium]|nr:hypothetical protein [Chloroflexota bacterium]
MALALHALTTAADDLAARAAERVAELESKLPALRAELDEIAAVFLPTQKDDELWPLREIETAQQYRWAGAIPVDE